MARKSAPASKPPAFPDDGAQAKSKLSEIRALRAEVKRCELRWGATKDELKERRDQLDSAVKALCDYIDESPQGALPFPSGETEHDDVKVTLSAGGESVTTDLAGLKRAARRAGRTASAVQRARASDGEAG